MVTVIISVAFNPADSYDFLRYLINLKPEGWGIVLGGWLIGCVLPDYLMIGKTRFVIWVLERAHLRIRGLIGTAFADFVAANWVFLTALSWVPVIFALVVVLFSGKTPENSGVLGMFMGSGILAIIIFLLTAALVMPTGILYTNIPLGNLFWSSMGPSVWLWIYLFASLLTRFLLISAPRMRTLVYALDVEHHPVRSIGVVAGAAVTLVAGIVIALASLVFW